MFYVHIDTFKKFSILYLDILQKHFIVTSAGRTYQNIPYHNCIHNCLPEDEPSGSKQVEDIKIKN